MTMDVKALELALTRLERLVPYLRRHVNELGQDPTDTHRAQVLGTVGRITEQLDVINGST